MSKNRFVVSDDVIFISHPDWNFTAAATIREDYIDEIKSVTWSINNGYLYSSKLGQYLHIYVVRKWYGNAIYEQMCDSNYIIDHMDNNSKNCKIENLCFLLSDENKGKGFTLDKEGKDKTFIALSLFKDFTTDLFQISIVFNNPANLVVDELEQPSVVLMAFLLYDTTYKTVIIDARAILNDYYDYGSFYPSRLRFIDYQIEGKVGHAISSEEYIKYREATIKSNHAILGFVKKNYFKDWNKDNPRQSLHILGYQG